MVLMDKARAVLRDVFRFSSFRLSQKAVIHKLLEENQNALVLFPTGGGKSLTYQVPALCLEGLTLVISPLIALMRDQVTALRARGVKASNLDSTLDAATASQVKAEVLTGDLKILYVAPERLNNEGFIPMMKRVKISLLAVDESHCISQWGSSFRPEYLKIARFAEEMQVERVLCLTATATKGVSDDICTSFNIDPVAGVFRTPVYRPNLSFKVELATNLEYKVEKLVPLLRDLTGPAIVYVTLQKHAEEVATKLKSHGFEPMVYHAGLEVEERERVQNRFMEEDNAIVCCTIAFGMGIDRANVRLVVHLYMPKTLENYSQEVGRAGRDGLPSTCLMFLAASDIPTLEGFARADTCAERDVQLWIQEVALKEPASDGALDFNLYQQSRTYDMRMNVLNLSYAQLELDYGYIRAITPFYSIYDLAPNPNVPEGWKKVLSDQSREAVVIRKYWKPKRSEGAQIDVVTAASTSGVDRPELARKINTWELDGLVKCRPSQVRMRYAVMNPLPKETDAIKNLADLIYQRMVAREEKGVAKIREVVKFATDGNCLAQSLAVYFGDEDSVPGGKCGNCTFCITGRPIQFDPQSVTEPDSAKIRAILSACPERDDPRLLARMAFGITSPRLTAGKWSTSHPLFGSMPEVDFNVLVKAFDEECKKAGYVRSDAVNSTPAAGSSKKRPSASSSYSSKRSNSGDSSRGRATKRARR